MATEIKVWQVSKQDGLIPVDDAKLQTAHLEKELELWIEKDPSILGEDLLVIDKQRSMEGVGRLDLLCIDADANLVIIELKRDSTSRQTIAQALDYASWLHGVDPDEIHKNAAEYLKAQGRPIADGSAGPLASAFCAHFDTEEMPEISCDKHRIILVAPNVDAAAERIITYLAEKYSMNIYAVFFKYARLKTGEEILARSVFIPEKTIEVQENAAKKSEALRDKRSKFTEPELRTIAEEKKSASLLEVCRKMNKDWVEHAAHVYGGSFVYWTKAGDNASRGGFVVRKRMVYGINVSGEQMKASNGELDVWIRTKMLAEATQVEERMIRELLEKQPPTVGTVLQSTGEKIWIRVTTPQQAEALVGQLQGWVSTNKQPTTTASEQA